MAIAPCTIGKEQCTLQARSSVGDLAKEKTVHPLSTSRLRAASAFKTRQSPRRERKKAQLRGRERAELRTSVGAEARSRVNAADLCPADRMRLL